MALGGSSYAAQGLGWSQQLKKNSITSPKVKPGSLLARDFKASQRARLRGPQGPAGAQGQPGTNGTAVGYANVRPDGTIVAAESAAIPGSFGNAATGVYCLADAPAGAKSVMVSGSSRANAPADADLLASVDLALNDDPIYTGCPNATDNVRVTIYNVSAGGTLVNGAFRIWFED